MAVVAFVALLGAAGFRSAPGLLMVPLEEEFGWPRTLMSGAVSINLILYGLMAPFAAALMDRFGIRQVTSVALLLVAAGSGLTVLVHQGWQLMLTWGLLIGLGTGSMAMVFAATVANRWFVARRGLVMGILTAAGATGQLAFLPVMATLVRTSSWRAASLVVTVASLAVIPLVLWVLRDYPRDRGVRAYGAPVDVPDAPLPDPAGAVRRTLAALRRAARVPTFWALAGGFAICGATTNGLVGTHFIPSAHDHGMPETTAAGLLALVGVFDIIGTIASGARVRAGLRAGLGGYGAAHRRAVPAGLRCGRDHRVRLSVRLPPDRCRPRGLGGRGDPRRHRAVHARLVRWGRPVRGGGRGVAEHPPGHGPGLLADRPVAPGVSTRRC